MTTDVLPIGRVIDGYRIEGPLGAGGFAQVYLARDAGGQPVALKVATAAEARDPLAAEARIAGRLSHPAVVPVHAAHLDHDPPYLALEYCPGGSLADPLEREGRLTPDAVADVLAQVLDCLAAAHEAGIVHRDLKPANLLIDGAGRVRLADFGLGQLPPAQQSLQLSLASQAGGAAGTLDYMAPEQRDGQGDHRVDLYALGVIAFELLTGRRPDRNDRLAHHVKLGADADAWERLYESLCARPERRLASAEAARAALDAISAPQAHSAPMDREPGAGMGMTEAILVLLVILSVIALLVHFVFGVSEGQGGAGDSGKYDSPPQETRR